MLIFRRFFCNHEPYLISRTGHKRLGQDTTEALKYFIFILNRENMTGVQNLSTRNGEKVYDTEKYHKKCIYEQIIRHY